MIDPNIHAETARQLEQAIRDLAAEKAARVALEVRKDATTWESDHQRLKLQEVGLADEFEAWGCDAIEHVAAALIAVRKQRDAEKAARERAEKELRYFRSAAATCDAHGERRERKRAEKAEAERDAAQATLAAERESWARRLEVAEVCVELLDGGSCSCIDRCDAACWTLDRNKARAAWRALAGKEAGK